MRDDEWTVELHGVGSITQLTDKPAAVMKRPPFGFSTEEEAMTPYRDRQRKGEYEPKKAKAAEKANTKNDQEKPAAAKQDAK